MPRRVRMASDIRRLLTLQKMASLRVGRADAEDVEADPTGPVRGGKDSVHMVLWGLGLRRVGAELGL